MKRIIFLIPLFVILGFGVVGLYTLKFGSDENPSALAGKSIPGIPTLMLDGSVGDDLSTVFEDNELVLVNFWASWCAPCRAEHPNLEKLREEGVPIIGINYKDIPENAVAFLEELGDPFYAVRVDDKGRFAIDWGVAGVPETFFVKNGKVVDRNTGPIVGEKYDEVVTKIRELKSN